MKLIAAILSAAATAATLYLFSLNAWPGALIVGVGTYIALRRPTSADPDISLIYADPSTGQVKIIPASPRIAKMLKRNR